jgi:hypothetical protein
MDNVYLVTLRNPSGNPTEIEEEYITADSQKDAELAAMDLVARHPFDGVSLISVQLIEPGDFYNEENANA